jgi:Serine dehydrogenase proteinase
MSGEATAAERDSNRIIEAQLDQRAEVLEQAADADVLSYLGGMWPPADDAIKAAVEVIQKRRRSLLVLLETGGGLIRVAERIALIFRHFYRRVDFVVPTYAMSAGTVLVMSGDAIHMDYASMLGPIDPQVPNREGRYVPHSATWSNTSGLSTSPPKKNSRPLSWRTSSGTSIKQSFTSMNMSATCRSRFLKSGWRSTSSKTGKVTATTKSKVTPTMRKARAAEIAMKLNDTRIWHSHDRGIPMARLQRDLNLLIDDFGTSDLKQPIHDYFQLLADYQGRRAHYTFVLHGRGRHVGL